MRTYLPRTVDDELARALRTSGAVVIKSPRACGKTETARRAAASEIGLDQDTAAMALSAADPRLLLDGATPRLLDEWQAVPGVLFHSRVLRPGVPEFRERLLALIPRDLDYERLVSVLPLPTSPYTRRFICSPLPRS